MPKSLMPRVYRWLLTASGFTLLVVGVTGGRGPTWGRVEQVVMIIAGCVLIVVAWRPHKRRLAHISAYLVGIAGLFEVVAHYHNWASGHAAYHIAALVLWMTFTSYTVLLVAYGWVGEGPKA